MDKIPLVPAKKNHYKITSRKRILVQHKTTWFVKHMRIVATIFNGMSSFALMPCVFFESLNTLGIVKILEP